MERRPAAAPPPESEDLPSDVRKVIVGEEEETRAWSSGPDRDVRLIKEEEEERWSGEEEEEELHGPEEGDITKLAFTRVLVKSEDEEQRPQSSRLQRRGSEEDPEARSPAGVLKRIKIEPADDEGEESEPAGGLEAELRTSWSPEAELENRTSESETDDDEDWIRARETGLRGVGGGHGAAGDGRPREGAVSCSECGKTFLSKSSLSCHKKVHSGEKPFVCSFCSKTFRKRSDLVVHLRSHTGEKPYSCSVCNTSFTKSNALVLHMRTHTGVKPFPCSVCGKMFSQKGHMTTHMRTHTGVKPFPCSVCGKMFSEKGHMRRHMTSHTGEKPFSCSVCGKTFSQKGHMTTHMAAHTGEKPFGCSACGKRFTWRSQFKRHECENGRVKEAADPGGDADRRRGPPGRSDAEASGGHDKSDCQG